jgi:mono/diheme cytochrome c family protein
VQCSRHFVLVVVLAGCSAVAAQTAKIENVGRTPTAEEVQAWDISINPVTGKELPPGKGTAKQGVPVYASKCAVCHGPTGNEVGPLGPRIVGTHMENGTTAAWPFASTIWDFINRAMPRYHEGTLTHDQVYALTALLLYRDGVIKEDDVMDAKSVVAVKMPNRDGYVPSFEDLATKKERICHLGHCPGPDPTAAH